MKNINRRVSPRIDIRLRCHVTSPVFWPSDGTFIENISRRGVLLSWIPAGPRIDMPRIGQILTVEIELPAHHGFGRKCIHLQGSVVRTSDPEQALPMVALSVNYMDFRSFADGYAAVQAYEPAVRGWMA